MGRTTPSGPDVVRGLLERGFETTIFHGGAHEVPLPDEVRHVHGDPHFPETIAEALGDSEFEVREEKRHRLADATGNKLGFRIAQTATEFLEAGASGAFAAT